MWKKRRTRVRRNPLVLRIPIRRAQYRANRNGRKPITLPSTDELVGRRPRWILRPNADLNDDEFRGV